MTALKTLILQRLDAGYTVRRIWQELTGQGKISVGRSSFSHQVQKIQREHKAGKSIPAPAPISRAMVTPQTAPASKRAADTTISQFHHDPVSMPLVLIPAVEDAEQREQDDHAS